MKLKNKICLSIIIGTLYFAGFVYPGPVVNIYQKNGRLQKRLDELRFFKYRKVDFNFDDVPLKKVQKIALHKGNIFILDRDRCALYVIDQEGHHIGTLGKAGLGPGDISDGRDFFVTEDDLVYVLNSSTKRIEVFSIDGKPLRTIRFMPDDSLSRPCSILVDKNKKIIVGSAFRELLVMIDEKGSHLTTFLTQNQFPGYPMSKINLGIPSSLEFLGDKILFFDRYKGIFSIINPASGSSEIVFSAYSDLNTKEIENFEEQIKSTPYNNITAVYWTNACIDEQQQVYVIDTSKEKNKPQNMFVFSKDGVYLYNEPLGIFSADSARFICCEKGTFAFMTYDFNLYLAYNRRNQK